MIATISVEYVPPLLIRKTVSVARLRVDQKSLQLVRVLSQHRNRRRHAYALVEARGADEAVDLLRNFAVLVLIFHREEVPNHELQRKEEPQRAQQRAHRRVPRRGVQRQVSQTANTPQKPPAKLRPVLQHVGRSQHQHVPDVFLTNQTNAAR